MTEAKLQNALQSIESGSAKDRTDGLTSLQHVFRHNKNNTKLESLKDATFSRIYHVLSDVVSVEQSTYLRAKTSTSRTTAANRLSAVAVSLRLAIEAGVSVLKLKTVRALIGHVQQTIRLASGDFCNPLALDYAKGLKTILAHQPHLTHFLVHEWEQLLDFVLDCLKRAEQEDSEHDVATGAERASTVAATTMLSYRSSRSGGREPGSSQSSSSSTRLIAEELTACLRLLTVPPNAPLNDRSSSLLWTVMETLRSSANVTRLQNDSFGTINNVLVRTRSEDIRLTREVTPHLTRLVTHFWLSKSSTLKDELLTTLILLRPYITDVANQGPNPTFKSELANVAKTIRVEYAKRPEREQLSLDDLRFEISPDDEAQRVKIAHRIFSLRCSGAKAEHNWFTIDSLAALSTCLIADIAEPHSYPESDDGYDEDLNKRPPKRRRTENEFEALVFPTLPESATTTNTLCSIQVLAFLAQQKALSTSQLQQVIDRLIVGCGEETSTTSSWAFLSLASCASQVAATHSTLSGRWNAVWQLATRALGNQSSCRTAAYAMYILLKLRLISQANISELVHTITNAIDLNGPTLLADSVVLLLTESLQDSQQHNPGAASMAADSTVRWWTRTYVPSRYDDRQYATFSTAYDVADIMSLASVCINKTSCERPAVHFPTWEALSTTWLHCSNQGELLAYLLLLPAHETGLNVALFKSPIALSGAMRSSCEALVLTHMTSELAQINDIWSRHAKGRPKSISTDALALLCKTCCFVASIACETGFRDTKRQMQLQRQVRVLLKSLSLLVASPSCEPAKRDVFLSIFSSMFFGLDIEDDDDIHNTSECERLLCQIVSETTTAISQPKDANNEDDMMDVDESNESQDSRLGSTKLVTSPVTDDLAMSFSKETLRAGCACYANAVIIIDNERVSESESQLSSTLMIDYILAQPGLTILSSRKVMTALPKLGLIFNALDLERLLDFLMEFFLGSYTYNRSEFAIGTVVDVMSSLTSVWSDPMNRKLYDLGVEIYEWFTNTALPGGIISPNVQQKLAVLLLKLCHVNTEYAGDSEAASVRTTLFGLLRTGSVTLQYHLAGEISSLFSLFVLSTHSAMFNDLQSSLPADAEWVEGIAMRLMILANLASAWHSLLRQCVYYMFDAAGRVQSSLGHATHCIEQLALLLPIKSPQKLFSLFAPQLLHTWLENQQLSDLPYAAFQYQSMLELLQLNQQEICAQLVMRGNEDGLVLISQALKLSVKDLVQQSFAKCTAYSISRDVCSIQNNTGSTPVETRLRNLLGTRDEFKKLLAQQYATVLGQFFLSLQLEDMEDSWLERRTGYSAAYNSLQEIKSYSRSERKLPDAQEPSFRSKYLCDQIERLCRRTSLDPTKPWDTSTFTLAVRMILDAMDESLGSLHASLMIRRLRILISMGGEVALEGFPLEMLVLSLRPFVNDGECADDVLGVLHYLLKNGQEHLKANLRFLGGSIIILVLQMRKHARTRQDSTTQESQHQATIQKMIDFQGWLVRYLSAVTEENLPVGYDVLINALKNLTLPGNARQGSPESRLLLFLLDQWSADEPLCSRPDCLEALNLLSERFEIPTPAEDCLAEDLLAVNYAETLWNVLQVASASQGFTVWAAQVLGRAYAASGSRPSKIIDLTADMLDEIPAAEHHDIQKSQKMIVGRLRKVLYSKYRHEAGLAEHTLRRIAVSFRDSAEAIAFESMLPSIIEPVIQQGDYGYRPTSAEELVDTSVSIDTLRHALEITPSGPLNVWTTDLAVVLCRLASKVVILPALPAILHNVDGLAQDLLPAIIHILLLSEIDKETVLRNELSKAAMKLLANTDTMYGPAQQFILKVVLYLRCQPIPGETTKVDRLRWLDLDLIIAADAAARCGMPACALFLAESNSPVNPSGRRTSTRASLSQPQMGAIPDDLLLAIFKQVEEPDSFYGIQQPASLQTVLERLDHESEGFESLMFRSAQTDSHMKRSHQLPDTDAAGLAHTLSVLNLNSLSFALSSRSLGNQPENATDMLTAARTLQQWDVAIPEFTSGEQSATFSIFQALSRAVDLDNVRMDLRSAIVKHVRRDLSSASFGRPGIPSSTWFSSLATLTEIGEVISCNDHGSLRSMWRNMQSRQDWMHMARYEEISPLLSNRQTLFGVLKQNSQAQNAMHISRKQFRAIEVESLLNGSKVAREHTRLQVALAAVSSLDDMMPDCKQSGLHIEAAVKLETASVLWDLGQGTASVKMLTDVLDLPKSQTQDIPVGEPGLLAQLGHQLALAKLERPEEILEKYLTPAVSQLKDRREGIEAGKVFFEFASFCDNELFNPGSIENFNRVSKLRQRKLEEIDDLKSVLKAEKRSDQKREMQRSLNKAQQWYDIDNAEWQRMKQNRDVYMQQSLRTYLLALRASDEHDICVLRFFALWLENAEESAANKIVSKYLAQAPSWKFVLLMNQLMSRLENDNTLFQAALKAMIVRLCLDHPYHSMHHLFAAHRKPMNENDAAAVSRYSAAQQIVLSLRNDRNRGELLNSMFLADRCYDGLAQAAPELRENTSKMATKDLSKALKVAQTVPPLKIPPATISISLRPDCDYSNVPTVVKFGHTISILGGLSAPKLLAVHATDGQEYKQIFKSGNDDLRQDAIMEQVFEEVSKMLRNHKATRQRDLKVRTYKVIPLSSNSGIIEFVPNSLPLGEFLRPAHSRYHPQDWRDSKARETIRAAAAHSPDTRLLAYRKVCEHVHPVLRHFFFERCAEPDTWFARRTAYTRTTAAVSVLGHVLGLGDRHCQNILLDERTGEVVHIDLGVAFEAGRVLPIPELVPFRLTRDIVDGMGATRTEGVFRRCCEFTLDALRRDKASIMTLLNVLRYDPLYTWTMSPLRARRLQEAQEAAAAARNGDADGAKKRRDENNINNNDALTAGAAAVAVAVPATAATTATTTTTTSSRKKDQEAGEADRALSIVEKKLATTLSTAATVNELIQQATDERHLAMLFGGWAAYY